MNIWMLEILNLDVENINSLQNSLKISDTKLDSNNSNLQKHADDTCHADCTVA